VNFEIFTTNQLDFLIFTPHRKRSFIIKISSYIKDRRACILMARRFLRSFFTVEISTFILTARRFPWLLYHGGGERLHLLTILFHKYILGIFQLNSFTRHPQLNLTLKIKELSHFFWNTYPSELINFLLDPPRSP
jgi:hypothetical protein